MNNNPFELPRTRIGLGGVRLINVAGAIHSESALKARPGMHPKTGKPYPKLPQNTISSAQAAELLDIRPVSARARLNRCKVRKQFSKEPYAAMLSTYIISLPNKKNICLLLPLTIDAILKGPTCIVALCSVSL